MNKLLLITSLGVLIALTGCKKDEKYSDIPEIEFVSITPSSVVEFSQQVTVKISYKDGNGDLGSEDPDEYSIFVKDARLPAADEYHLQPLSPPNTNLQIEGELDIVLSGLFVLDTVNYENTTFKIKLRDQAGNFSNEVTTSNLRINKAS